MVVLPLGAAITWREFAFASEVHAIHKVVAVKVSYVTVVEDPISFSPFPSTDCMLYSHFSFDDFIMIAFPDLTRDLDDQI